MPYATPQIELALTGDNVGAPAGIFAFDSSLFDGPDVFGGGFGGDVLDDITADVKEVSGSRGRSTDLGAIEMGTMQVVLSDPTGKYNPRRLGYASEVLADDPAGYWRLGEVSGTTAADSGGGALDGTYTGGVTLGEAGAPDTEADTAVLLNGTTGYVALPTAAALNITGPITMDGWVKTTSAAAHSNLVGGFQNGGGFPGYGFRLNNGLPGYYSSIAASWVEPSTSVRVNDGAYHHVAVAVSGTTATFYIDGTNVGSATSAQPGSYSGARALGRAAQVATEFLAGTMDDWAIYPSALSAVRILAHYRAGFGLGPRIRPMRRIRCRLTYNGTTHGRFSGFIRRAWHNPAKDVKESYIDAVDLFLWLSRVQPVIAATGETTVGAAIGLILDAAEWPSGERALDTGITIPDFSADGTKSALQLIQDLLTADLGMFFIDKDGIPTYLDKDSRWGPQDPVATLSGDLLSGALPGVDGERIVNGQTVTRAGGTPQTATDEASRAEHGPLDGAPVNTPYLTNDHGAAALAQLLVALQKDPVERGLALVLHNRDETAIGHQLARDLGQQVAISASTDGGLGASEGMIARIDWRIDLAGRHDTVALAIGERILTGFAFDESLFDGDDVFL